MINTVARHRISDLGEWSKKNDQKQLLKNSVSTYLEYQQLQLDAQEDDDLLLAKSIGKSMKEIRLQFDQSKWVCEVEKQLTR